MAEDRKEIFKWLEALQNDPRPTQRLAEVAVDCRDLLAALDAITALGFRGTREVFDTACALCASASWQERITGTAILGRLGPRNKFCDEAIAVLRQLVEDDFDEEVMYQACRALGELGTPTALSLLLEWKRHPQSAVRVGVACGLYEVTGPAALDGVIALSTDPDVEVRREATTSLKGWIDPDTPELCEALLARLSDDDTLARVAALTGLVGRDDERVLEPLIRELESYTQGRDMDDLLFSVADLGDPRLLPALRKLKQAGVDTPALDEAIQACAGTAD